MPSFRDLKKRFWLTLASVLAMAATGLTAASQCSAEKASLYDNAGNCLKVRATDNGCLKVR